MDDKEAVPKGESCFKLAPPFIITSIQIITPPGNVKILLLFTS